MVMTGTLTTITGTMEISSASRYMSTILSHFITERSAGKLIPEVICMEPTYTDRYANLIEDPAMEAYFSQLPGYIQAQIRARKQQPATLDELQRMAEDVKQLF